MCGLAVVILSCTTETLSVSEGSPTTQGQVPAGSPSTTTRLASIPTARPAPVTLEIAGGGSSHGRVRQPPDPSSAPTTHTPTTYPPTTHPPVSTSIDYGPARIDTIQASFVEEWRDLVSVWFRSSDVNRVLAIIECESSGRWNAVGPEIKHLDMVALGLMQHLDGYWPDRAIKAEAAGYHNHGDIWSPTDQMAVSAYLAYNTPQGFSHWVCDKGDEQ
jgi:hypothetical protein